MFKWIENTLAKAYGSKVTIEDFHIFKVQWNLVIKRSDITKPSYSLNKKE